MNFEIEMLRSISLLKQKYLMQSEFWMLYFYVFLFGIFSTYLILY